MCRIAYATLPAANIERARRFYSEKLGLDPDEVEPDGSLLYKCEGSGFLVYQSQFAGTAKNTAVGFRTDNLDKVSDAVFTSADAPIESSGWVKQGFLESSNVDVIKEMVRMIETLREYEAYQKAIHSFDDASAKLTNDMGRV